MMTMPDKRRIVLYGILVGTLLWCLFGCGKQYDVKDVVGVSLWESTMDRSASYSYGLLKEGETWYLSASCGRVGRHESFECMYLPVNADAILDTVKVDGYIRKTRSRKFFNMFASDTPSRGVMLTFSDDTRQSAAIAAPSLREAFMELATALEEKIPVYTIGETTGLYLSANCMQANDRYSFELYLQDGIWYLSANCQIDGQETKPAETAFDESRTLSLTDIPVSAEDAYTLLTIAFEEALDEKVFTYRELPNGLCVLDEDVYQVSMRFGKEEGTARIRPERLEESFFAIAEKYAGYDIVEEE